MLERLAVPFAAGIVQWKPQSVNRDKTRCLALAYVEVQPYQRRLDEVAPGWEDSYDIVLQESSQPDKDRQGNATVIPGKVFVKCKLTLPYYVEGELAGAVSRMDVGECSLTDDNAVTSAKAQAFKRTCAAFGLGRYLYDLPRTWVDFDKDNYGISAKAITQLNGNLARLLDQKMSGTELPQRKPPIEAGVSPTPQAPAQAPQSANGERNGSQASESKSESAAERGNGSGSPDIKSCSLHNVAMRKKTRGDGSEFWYHQLADGAYCDGQKVRPPRRAAGNGASA